MIPDAEKDQIRADALALLQSSCRVLTLELVSDGGGGHTEQWVPGPMLPCRMAPAGTGQPGVTGQRPDESSTHVFTLPYDAEITHESRIQHGDRVWAVTAIPERDKATTFVRRVEVVEVT